ncbi:hypothetical protein HYX58_01205 [Candidatus Dependentiae bacterium]|nr:hypothetical protein [Candidatus Dependentiae bacterium]
MNRKILLISLFFISSIRAMKETIKIESLLDSDDCKTFKAIIFINTLLKKTYKEAKKEGLVYLCMRGDIPRHHPDVPYHDPVIQGIFINFFRDLPYSLLTKWGTIDLPNPSREKESQLSEFSLHKVLPYLELKKVSTDKEGSTTLYAITKVDEQELPETIRINGNSIDFYERFKIRKSWEPLRSFLIEAKKNKTKKQL